MTDSRKYNISLRLVEEDNELLYCATVKELPDVSVYEKTAQDAYDSALAVISDLQDLFLKKGKPFPEPIAQEEEFSGRTTLRLSKSLHARVAHAAESDNISLNQWIVEAVAWRLDGARVPRTVVAPNAISVNYNLTGLDDWTIIKKGAIKQHFLIQSSRPMQLYDPSLSLITLSNQHGEPHHG